MTNSAEIFPSYRAKEIAIGAAWDLVETRLLGLPDPLGPLAARFFASISGEGSSHRLYFSNPAAPPLLYLPLWLYDGLVAAGSLSPNLTLAPLLAATMQGYFFVRLQDDMLDDPSRRDLELSLLGNACLSGMVAGFTEILGAASGAFFQAFDRAFVEFSSLTLAEQRSVRHDGPYPASLFEAHTGKVAFARVPMLVVATLAGQLGLETKITTLIKKLGFAYGLTNDALGWPRDLRAGHRTYLLAEAGLEAHELQALESLLPGATRDAALEALAEAAREKLYEGGLLRRTVQQAIETHESALAVAEDLGLPGFEAFTHDRIQWLSTIDRQILAFSLQRALGLRRS